jgi:hypothetical protein
VAASVRLCLLELGLVLMHAVPGGAQATLSPDSCDTCPVPGSTSTVFRQGTDDMRVALYIWPKSEAPNQLDPGFSLKQQCEDHLPRVLIVSGGVGALAGYVFIRLLEDDPIFGPSEASDGERFKVIALSAGLGVAFGALYCFF